MKEVTLEELENFSGKISESTKPNANEQIKSTESTKEEQLIPAIIRPNIMKGTDISPSDLGRRLREKNGIPEKKDEIKDAPIVENAFTDMVNTVNERKKRIDEEIMPIIEKNAEEMTIAEEMGIDTSKEKLDNEEVMNKIKEKMKENEKILDTELPDDLSDINNILEDNESMEEYSEGNYVEYEDNINTKEVVQSKIEQPTIKKEEPPKVESTVVKEETKVEKTDDDSDDLDKLMSDLNTADADDTSDLNDNEESVEELRGRFKETLSSVKIARDPIDFSKFKIKQSPVSSSAVLSSVNDKMNSFKKADWVLYHTGRSMTFLECRGPELNALRKNIGNSNDINAIITSLKFIYNHTLDANKPPFEAWCKLIRTEDIESLYFGIYKACYADTNIVARACENKKCGKTSLINTNINSMVKFEDDEVKDKFYKIYNRDTTTSVENTESELLQISDYFAISFSSATLYSTFLQYASLPSDITNKYSDTLNSMAYIDGFYSINYDTQELIPIAIKSYRNNLNKTVIAKLKVYIEILKTLTNDQYNVLTAKLNTIIQNPKVSYVYPEATCPECGAKMAEEPIDSVMRLLFTRAQLVQVKSL